MSADDEWWAVERDPIEDALADCRNGHHGSGSVVLAEYVDQLRSRVTALVAAGQYLADVMRAGSSGTYTVSCLGALERWEEAAQGVTASADHG